MAEMGSGQRKSLGAILLDCGIAAPDHLRDRGADHGAAHRQFARRHDAGSELGQGAHRRAGGVLRPARAAALRVESRRWQRLRTAGAAPRARGADRLCGRHGGVPDHARAGQRHARRGDVERAHGGAVEHRDAALRGCGVLAVLWHVPAPGRQRGAVGLGRGRHARGAGRPVQAGAARHRDRPALPAVESTATSSISPSSSSPTSCWAGG